LVRSLFMIMSNELTKRVAQVSLAEQDQLA